MHQLTTIKQKPKHARLLFPPERLKTARAPNAATRAIDAAVKRDERKAVECKWERRKPQTRREEEKRPLKTGKNETLGRKRGMEKEETETDTRRSRLVGGRVTTVMSDMIIRAMKYHGPRGKHFLPDFSGAQRSVATPPFFFAVLPNRGATIVSRLQRFNEVIRELDVSRSLSGILLGRGNN